MELKELIRQLEKDERVRKLQERALSEKIIRELWVIYKGQKWFPCVMKDRKTNLIGFDFNTSGAWGPNADVGRRKISLAEMLARTILRSYDPKASVRCKNNGKGSTDGRMFSDLQYDNQISSIINTFGKLNTVVLENSEDNAEKNELVDDTLISSKELNLITFTEDDESQEELGYQADPEKRKCIELYAEDWAVEYYKRLGFSVEKKGKPYDLLCTKGDLTVHVEAKGTMGLANKVILTRNEVTDARNSNWRSDLFVVRRIVLVKVEGIWQASGGGELLFEKWEPVDDDLIPMTYEYTVPKKQ